MYIRPLEIQADSSNIAVTTSSQALAITGAGALGNRTIRLTNSGTQVIFFKLGISTTTAALATSTPMLPNSAETFLLRADVTHVAVIASATGSTLYATVGEGA